MADRLTPNEQVTSAFEAFPSCGAPKSKLAGRVDPKPSFAATVAKGQEGGERTRPMTSSRRKPGIRTGWQNCGVRP
jgi:hypothetical protein